MTRRPISQVPAVRLGAGTRLSQADRETSIREAAERRRGYAQETLVVALTDRLIGQCDAHGILCSNAQAEAIARNLIQGGWTFPERP